MKNVGEKNYCFVYFSEQHGFIRRTHRPLRRRGTQLPVCYWRRGGGRLVISQLPEFKAASGGMSAAAFQDKQLSRTGQEETRRHPQTATSGSRSGTGEGKGVLCLLCSVFTWKKVDNVYVMSLFYDNV